MPGNLPWQLLTGQLMVKIPTLLLMLTLKPLIANFQKLPAQRLKIILTIKPPSFL
jgi:hypothetical protein